MDNPKILEGDRLLRKANFSLFVMKANELNFELERDLEVAMTPQEIDDKIVNKFK
jgi:hypothetical protein